MLSQHSLDPMHEMVPFKNTLTFHGTGYCYCWQCRLHVKIHGYILVTDRHTIPSTAVEYTNHCMVTPLHVYCDVWRTCTVYTCSWVSYHELCVG